MPFHPLFGERSPTKIDYRKKSGTLILTSLLEDLEECQRACGAWVQGLIPHSLHPSFSLDITYFPGVLFFFLKRRIPEENGKGTARIGSSIQPPRSSTPRLARCGWIQAANLSGSCVVARAGFEAKIVKGVYLHSFMPPSVLTRRLVRYRRSMCWLMSEVSLDQVPQECPFAVSFLGEGSTTKIRLQNKVGTLILTSLLEDLVDLIDARSGFVIC